MDSSADKRRTPLLGRFLTVLGLCVVIVIATMVRTPRYGDPATDPGSDQLARQRYAITYPLNRVGRNGLPYLLEVDGYYHLRISEDLARDGSFGTPGGPDGSAWDTLRFAPEGLPASYHDGICRTAVAIWRALNVLGGVELEAVCFWLSVPFATLTALAAFALARCAAEAFDAHGEVAGLAAALLVSCSPAFVRRTLAGTFDTDMTQLLFTTLLVLLMAQALCASSRRRSLACAVLFSLGAAAFTRFWSASCLAFILIAFAGGALALGCRFVLVRLARARGGQSAPGTAALMGYGAACLLSPLFITILNGTGYLGHFLYLFRNASSKEAPANLPHLFVSISEMQPVRFAPANPRMWLSGQGSTVVNSVGGILVLVTAGVALVTGAAHLFTLMREMPAAGGSPHDTTSQLDRQVRACTYLCLLATWLVACLYGLRIGARMVEHLAAPAGVLAGVAIGLAAGKPPVPPSKWLLALLVATSVCAPVLGGSARLYPNQRGAVTDAYEQATDWVATSAETPEAVIASWWDLGYYYEFASGHPVLWDGGSHDSPRALIIGKALTSTDPTLSRALLLMLSTSGNEPVNLLCDALGTQRGFEALWALAPKDRTQTLAELQKLGFDLEAATRLEALLHPASPTETYLVLTKHMMRRLGWIEYYANWDFEGDNQLPRAVGSHETPDGLATITSDDPEVVAFFERRKQGLSWQLFYEGADLGPAFEEVCSAKDGAETVRVWRVR